MSAPDPANPGPDRPRTMPTRAARPPVPPPAVADEPTVGLPDRRPAVRLPTLRFGKPAPVKVTVTARRRPRRRHRTWPWIVAVVLALVVLGVILLVMLLNGATIDGDTDILGAATP